MKKRILIMLLAVIVLSSGIGTIGAEAVEARAIEVDYDVYSLWVDELPEGIYESTYIAARLLKTSLDPEQYILTMIDDEDSLNKLHKAMESAKIKPEQNRNFAMDVRLYEYDEDEGDYYASSDSDVEVIVPVSDNMFQYDENEEAYLQSDFLKVVSVSSSGKLSYPEYELVSVDDIICAKFTVTDNGVYGFLLYGVAPEGEEDEEVVPTATPDSDQSTDQGSDGNADSDQAPTKAPTATPVPTKAPTKAPTAAPQKDKTPQTGDDHNSGFLLLLGSVSAITLGAVIVAWKRDEKEEA